MLIAPLTMQAAATGTGDGKPLETLGNAKALLQMTLSAGTSTVTVEGTMDGSTWHAVPVRDLDETGSGSTMTASGVKLVLCPGMTSIRARISAIAGGAAVTVLGRVFPD